MRSRQRWHDSPCRLWRYSNIVFLAPFNGEQANREQANRPRRESEEEDVPFSLSRRDPGGVVG